MSLGNYIKRLASAKPADDLVDSDAVAKAAVLSASSTAMLKPLMGTIGIIDDFHFPSELIGGTCPRIAGEEEELVWNAAAEACDTERVHVIWQALENRIWYLAVRSSELASHPNSWCPLGALLPTMKDASPPPVCYTYFGEESAVLMSVTADSLQVFRGTGPVVRAKAERTAREMGNVPIVNLDAARIEQLTPVPWYSVSLFEDRARRILATVSVLASLVVTGVSFFVWLLANMAQVASNHNLSEAMERTENKSMQLVQMAEAMRSSPLREQIDKFLDVNDGLLTLNGFLNVYEVKDGKPRWRAQVPPSATADRITAMGGKNIETTDSGVAIGNDAEIAFEADKKK